MSILRIVSARLGLICCLVDRLHQRLGLFWYPCVLDALHPPIMITLQLQDLNSHSQILKSRRVLQVGLVTGVAETSVVSKSDSTLRSKISSSRHAK